MATFYTKQFTLGKHFYYSSYWNIYLSKNEPNQKSMHHVNKVIMGMTVVRLNPGQMKVSMYSSIYYLICQYP